MEFVPKKPIPYGKHFIDDSDIQAVIETLKSDSMTQGPKVEEFERALAKYCGAKYAVAFSNGTAALHGAYHASGIGEGNNFITSTLTFVATANAGLYCGAEPILCDINSKTYNIDLDKAKKLVTPNTKVIAPVSLAGYPADLEDLFEWANERGITVIHDAAHAIGATVRGQSVSKFAHMTMLSFHPVKHVATGEGGAIITDCEKFYESLLRFRTHGITKSPDDLIENHGGWYYEMQELGFNYRITELQCSLGISQIKKLENSLKRRQEIAEIYNSELNLDWLTLPQTPHDGVHAFHLYPVLVNDEKKRKPLYDYLHENNIKVQVHYVPIHCMPYYRNNFGFKIGDFPNAEDFYSREISLPMYPTLTYEEQQYVIKKVKEFENL